MCCNCTAACTPRQRQRQGTPVLPTATQRVDCSSMSWLWTPRRPPSRSPTLERDRGRDRVRSLRSMDLKRQQRGRGKRCALPAVHTSAIWWMLLQQRHVTMRAAAESTMTPNPAKTLLMSSPALSRLSQYRLHPRPSLCTLNKRA